MRVSTIGNNFCCNRASMIQKQQSFKGLWGPTMYESDTKVLSYYPFCDETQQKIDNLVKVEENKNEKVKVEIRNNLGFSKNEYENFKTYPYPLSDELYGRISRTLATTARNSNGSPYYREVPPVKSSEVVAAEYNMH